MSQLINEQEFSYDLIILDKKLEPIKYLMPFKKELVQGVTFHYSRPLLKNFSHVFYTAWWRDTVTTITGSAEVEYHFFFDYGEQTIPTFLSKKSALCGIEWIIEFEFTSDEVNHVDEIMNIPISPGSSFGQLNLTVDALHDAAPQGIPLGLAI